MATKKISVNPAFLKINGSKTLKKRERKDRKIMQDLQKKQNNELKKGLLEKIKTHKKLKKEEKLKQKNNILNDDTTSELDKSLSYLHELSNKHKSRKQKKRQLKLARKMERQSKIQQSMSHTNQAPLISKPLPPQEITNISVNTPPASTNLNTPKPSARILTEDEVKLPVTNINPLVSINTAPPPVLSAPPPTLSTPPETNILSEHMLEQKPDPPYGILKNGKKPLFSVYNKTLKKPTASIVTTPPIIVDNDINLNTSTNLFSERKNKLNQLKQSINNDNINTSQTKRPSLNKGKTLKKVKQTSTTTKRFIHLGKKNGKVGVLIKNQKTRKKILKDTNTLKKRPLSKIKDYLRKHNLIKIGSNAPETIIRSIYENSFLSGDVYNKNIDTLLHNYLDK